MTCRPLPVRLLGLLYGPWARQVTILMLALFAACVVAVPALAEPPEIASKKAEVQQVLGQIQALDGSLGLAIEAYNKATVRLDEIEHRQELNRRDLKLARRNLKLQQQALARRLVSLYSGDRDTTWLGVLLGASSVTQLVDRLDTVQRVANQDAQVVRQVERFRSTIERNKRQLARSHGRQADLVAEREEQRASIQSQLAERRQLAESIKSEIARLEAEERARQERLRREAQARLAAQRAAAAVAAAAAEAAAAERRRVARVAAEQTTHAHSDDVDLSTPDAVADADETYTPEITVDEVGVVAETPEASIVPSSGSRGTDVVAAAMQYLGVPYVWGGASPSGFDCSGLMLYAYAQLGISLPHYTGDQWQLGVAVSQDQLEPGDIVFFNGLGHNGMYIGGGQFIHAPHSGDVVKISNLSDSWYAATYEGARRIL